MKKILSIALCVLLMLTMLVINPVYSQNSTLNVLAVSSLTKSGDLNAPSPTKQELLDAWNLLDISCVNKLKTAPSVVYPYSIGEVHKDHLQSGEDLFNYIRYTAHLPSVQMTDELNESAQYGAVVMAANNVLSHCPDKPADMDDDFYQKGHDATSSSNISCGTLGYMSIVRSLLGCCNDRGSNNLATVGHRRWMLNPSLQYVGFGYAESNEWGYVATKVFDYSRTEVDFDFVSWPPSGNCLNEIVSYDAPFTITLNPDKFKSPQDSDIKITVIRESDGKVWSFDSQTNRTPGSDKYMLIEKSWYAINNCIIFRPDVDELKTHKGVYTFSVSGVYKNDGTEVTLNYKTDFFDTSYVGSEEPDPDIIPEIGDVDCSGAVDKRDYAILKRYCIGTTDLTEKQRSVADIDGDGNINKRDFALLKRICLQK